MPFFAGFVSQWWVLLILVHVVADQSYKLTKGVAKFLVAVYLVFLLVCGRASSTLQATSHSDIIDCQSSDISPSHAAAPPRHTATEHMMRCLFVILCACPCVGVCVFA